MYLFSYTKKSLSSFSWNANDAYYYSTNVKTLNTKACSTIQSSQKFNVKIFDMINNIDYYRLILINNINHYRLILINKIDHHRLILINNINLGIAYLWVQY